MNAAQSPDRPERERRGLLDRPVFDWLLVGVIVFVVLRWTPLVGLFTGTSQDGQRSAMSNIASVLGTITGLPWQRCSSMRLSTTRRQDTFVLGGAGTWRGCSSEPSL